MANQTHDPMPDPFIAYLADSFQKGFRNNGMETSDADLFHFLLDIGLVSKTKLQQYAVRKALEELMPGGVGNKTHAVGMLAQRFHISERTVWKTLKDSQREPFKRP